MLTKAALFEQVNNEILLQIKTTVLYLNIFINICDGNAGLSELLLQSLVSHDHKKIIIICTQVVHAWILSCNRSGLRFPKPS